MTSSRTQFFLHYYYMRGEASKSGRVGGKHLIELFRRRREGNVFNYEQFGFEKVMAQPRGGIRQAGLMLALSSFISPSWSQNATIPDLTASTMSR